MSTTISTISPSSIYKFDVNPVNCSFAKVGNAMEQHNYPRAVEFATITMDQIRRSMLFTVLEQRAHALCQVSQYEAAIRDAQEMISIAPKSTVGYIHLGKIYAMQGNQQAAIKTYETALENALSLDQDNNFTHDSITNKKQQQYKELINGKNSALERIRKRIDIISMLPKELSNTVFTKLDQKSKAICLRVSRKWRKSLLECPMAWYDLNMNDSNGLVINKILLNTVPLIEKGVRHLIMDTQKVSIYEQVMIDGIAREAYFKNVKSLKITENTISYVANSRRYRLEPFISPKYFPNGKSLTALELKFPSVSSMSSSCNIKLRELLFTCPNLLRLVYLSPGSYSVSFGDRNLLSDMQHPLMDLTFQLQEIGRATIERLLTHCRQLRRLVLHNCLEDCMDLFDTFCPKLQILGYNCYTDDIPELDETFFSLSNTRRRGWTHHCEDDEDGLQEIHVSGYSTMFQGQFQLEHILPLIQKNASTLKVIHIGYCSVYNKNDRTLLEYNKLGRQLIHLKNLIIEHNGDHPFAQILLRSISYYRDLSMLQIPRTNDLLTVVNNIITLKGSLKNLKICLPMTETDDNVAYVMQLFQHYITLSLPSPSSLLTVPMTKMNITATTITHHAPPPPSTLEKISLLDPTNFLTDDVLNMIADIKTISSIDLITNSSRISAEGLHIFFYRASTHLTHLRLGSLGIVDDKLLLTMGEVLTSLTHIKLGELKLITDYGVISLMEKRSATIKYIAVSGCPLLTDTVRHYAECKYINFVCL
ncbi:hypothetical protein BDA99DRAFT_512728 [Phascolomyces articulosus]|uniref:F-box domain-containing protein n=1 Tax=Phascolomyces articulosus TaxID=60185 RepID=A0AAD5K823_9FUNG|nr:hypothetical protein BDA99DRAFT_512728 [Phascolomyces articulosus]